MLRVLQLKNYSHIINIDIIINFNSFEVYFKHTFFIMRNYFITRFLWSFISNENSLIIIIIYFIHNYCYFTSLLLRKFILIL